jgi:hypothetical protein
MQSNGGRFEGRRLLSPESVALMHAPRSDLGSPYAMGWYATTHQGQRLIEHNGILSTFYAEAVLAPETGHGIVLLYNVSSLASTLLAFPEVKAGLLALLRDEQPTPRALNVGTWGLIVGAITLLGAALALRSLLRLPRWAAEARAGPLWRSVLGIAWTFVPTVALLTLPTLIARTSDRVFGYQQLARSMLGITIWLGICALLGLVNGAARLVLLARRWGFRRRDSPASNHPGTL